MAKKHSFLTSVLKVLCIIVALRTLSAELLNINVLISWLTIFGITLPWCWSSICATDFSLVRSRPWTLWLDLHGCETLEATNPFYDESSDEFCTLFISALGIQYAERWCLPKVVYKLVCRGACLYVWVCATRLYAFDLDDQRWAKEHVHTHFVAELTGGDTQTALLSNRTDMLSHGRFFTLLRAWH